MRAAEAARAARSQDAGLEPQPAQPRRRSKRKSHAGWCTQWCEDKAGKGPGIVCKTNYDIHAHHITYAQSNGMGLKVCDSYTVPLCMFHHMELHQQYGNERKFWLNYCLEPIIYSQLLWKITCK